MKNYTDGYSFLGEAFINFVTALAVYEMFPNETSASLTTFANLFRNNAYIADVYSYFEIANLISKVRKDQQTKKKSSKQLASSFKGLIGMMFVQHGNSKMIDIMKFVNNIIIPNNKVDFTGKEAINSITDIGIMWFGLACVMFGWLLCYTMIVLDPITTCKISL
jgi:dsRNA-specific ribonuclease